MNTDSLKRLTRINPFAVVEYVVTLASLALVGLVVGRELGPMTGLTEQWAPLVTWPVALIFDVLWIGALRMAAESIRQRNTVATLVLGAVALVTVAASTAILWRLGHLSVFSLMPAATMAFMGLRLFTENALADPATQATIARAGSRVRNDRALAASEARDLAADAKTDVVLSTARHVAALRRDEALANVLTDADNRMTKVRAGAAKRLEAARSKHGEAASRYAELMSASTVPTALDTPVSRGDTQASELESAFDDALAILGDTADTPALVEALDLADVASVQGVETPEPETELDDAQVAVVLRWMRYSVDPPRSYRQAQKEFRAAKFRASDARLRAVWAELDAEAELPAKP